MPLARKINRMIVGKTPLIMNVDNRTAKSPVLKCAVAYNEHGGYCIPESSFHRPAAQKVLSGKVYEPKTIKYIVANCEDKDVIHAGTFFGDFLPALSSALTSTALIWAFEPNKENFRCAEITLKLNEITNVRLAHFGLGAVQQDLYVQTTDPSGRSLGGASRIVTAANDVRGKERVGIVTIDEKIPPNRDIGILQLDVEGYEKQALSGALATIRRCLPILILEVLPNSNLVQTEWFSDNILRLGYENVAKLHGNSVYSCSAHQKSS